MYTRRQDDIMAFRMRRQFAAWMPARAQAGAAPMTLMKCPPHSMRGPGRHTCWFLRFVSFYVHAESSWSKRSQEYTHKYCLFLASLNAARVWSLLKSPECEFKMSSMKIPAFDLHMSVRLCVAADHVWMCLFFFNLCWKCAFFYWHHQGVL